MKSGASLWAAVAFTLLSVSGVFFFLSYGPDGVSHGRGYAVPLVFSAALYCPAMYVYLYKYTKKQLFNSSDKQGVSFRGRLLNPRHRMRLPYLLASIPVVAALVGFTLLFIFRTSGYGKATGVAKYWNLFVTGGLLFTLPATLSMGALAVMSLEGIGGYLRKVWDCIRKYLPPFFAFQLSLTVLIGLGYALMKLLPGGRRDVAESLASRVLGQSFDTTSFSGFLRGPMGIMTSMTGISVYGSMFSRVKDMVNKGEAFGRWKKEFADLWKDKGVLITLAMTALCVILSAINTFFQASGFLWLAVKALIVVAWLVLSVKSFLETSVSDVFISAISIAALEQCFFSAFDFSQMPALQAYGLMLLVILLRVCLYLFFALANSYVFRLIRESMRNLNREERQVTEEALDDSLVTFAAKRVREANEESREAERRQEQLESEVQAARSVMADKQAPLGRRAAAAKEAAGKTLLLKRGVILAIVTVVGLLLYPPLVVVGWAACFFVWRKKKKNAEKEEA